MTEPDAHASGLADHVDALWDALVRGAPPAADPLAPELTDEIRRLHAADRTPHADPAFLARLREELNMTPLAPLAALPLRPRGFAPTSNGHVPVAPTARRRSAPHPRRRWWGVVERLLAAVLVLGLIGGYLALTAGTPAPGDGAPAAELFLTDGGRQRLSPIDAETLAPLPDATPIAIEIEAGAAGIPAPEPFRQWRLSADGSTLVRFEARSQPEALTAEQITLVVHDGPGGRERARFHPPVPLWNGFDLSADGDRLLGQRGQVYFRDGLPDLADPQAWYVFDTATGDVVSTIPAGERWSASGNQLRARLSPDGRRVFVFAEGTTTDPAGPGSLRLSVYDADDGGEIGRLALPDVRSGRWSTGRTIGGRPVAEYDAVGTAFSPDGRRLALVHDDGAALTIVDTARLAVERAVAIDRGADPLDVVAHLPATPEALDGMDDLPYEVGRGLWVEFGADGRGLYVGGWDRRVDAVGRETCRDLALRRVDIVTGTVLAVAPPAETIDPVVVAADGESVYSIGSRIPNACFPSYQDGSLLRRLDADTLEVRAERKVPGFPTIELIPRVSGGW